MIVEGPNLHHARAAAVRPSEKIRLRKRLAQPGMGTAQHESAFPEAKGPENMSRFGTRSIVVIPASAFAAQILGQALGGNRPDPHGVADAYAHAAETRLPPALSYRLRA